MPSESFQHILNTALDDYIKQTKIDPTSHPLAARLRNFHSPNDVLEVLEERANKFKDYRNGNRKLIDCLKPVVKSVHALSSVLGEAIRFVSQFRSLFLFTFLSLSWPGSVPTGTSNLHWCGCSPCCSCPRCFPIA